MRWIGFGLNANIRGFDADTRKPVLVGKSKTAELVSHQSDVNIRPFVLRSLGKRTEQNNFAQAYAARNNFIGVILPFL
jgi:hypothetical protein